MNNIKEKLANALIEILDEKSLNDVKVVDIVSKCGVSRQAFYYHFKDIPDIIEWFFCEEIERILNDDSTFDNWRFAYISILQWSAKHKNLIINVYKSVSREAIEYFMNRNVYNYIITLVKKYAEGMNVNESQCRCISLFYTLSLNAISLDWIKKGMREKPEELMKNVEILLKGALKHSLTNFEKENK